MSDSHANSSHLCQPGMLDPAAAIALSFIANPSPFRLASRWTLNCYQHSIYLESERPCPYVIPIERVKADPQEQEEEGENGVLANSSASLSRAFPLLLAAAAGLKSVKPPKAGFYQMQVVNVSMVQFPATRKNVWPRQCSHLNVQQCPNLATIGPDYPKQETRKQLLNLHPKQEKFGLRVATLQGLPTLKSIENDVFTKTPTLEEVQLVDLPNLTTIGNNFCFSSEQLRTVTFRALPLLETVGEYLLASTGLKEVEIFDLPALQSIGEVCLNDCQSLTKVCIRDLPALTTVGSYWIHNCEVLQRVEFSGLPNLTEAGSNFLSHGAKVSKLDALEESEVVLGKDCTVQLVDQAHRGLIHRSTMQHRWGSGSDDE